MQLDPGAQRVLDLIKQAGRPPYETMEPRVAREFYRASRATLQPAPQPVAEVRNLAAPGPRQPIPLRLYRGMGMAAGGLLPGLVYYHGGGWAMGDLETHDGLCRQLANDAGVIVVAVDYRLAPEHKFPAGIEDAIAATEWIAANAAKLGIDASRLGAGGDSAGGNFAAVVCLTARDRGGPPIRFQLLIYPVTDHAMTHESHRRFSEGLPLTHTTMVWFRDLYLRGPADIDDWRASPLRAKSLKNLPPAYIMTAGFDPLCDEGADYARRLAEAGVPVEYRCFEAQIHGFITMGKIISATSSAISGAAASVKKALAKG